MMNEHRENFGLSMKNNGFSIDMLHKYMNGKRFSNEEEEGDGNEEIELSLGLSTNGRFGVDPKRAAKKLKRSSSISNLVFTVGPGGGGGGQLAVGLPVDVDTPLTRTCSLPVGAEEELRKRRELRSIRRMEAKKKRLEKLNNGRVVKDKVYLEANSSEDNNNNNKNNNNCEINGIVKGRINVNSNGNEIPLSQGSIGSQGSGSSGISDIQSQRSEGVKQSTEAKSPPSVQSLPAQIGHKPVGATEKEAKEIHKNVMLDMPHVSTRGDGPNGKKIEGFLYQYKKGEEVKIVCVCHGRFLSPAEFVKHAGGADVENPLRHIVVNHSLFL